MIMRVFRRLLAGFVGLVRRDRMARDVDEELRAYFEASIEEKMRGGMPVDDARRAARLELGSAAAIKDSVMDVGWESVVESTWLDLRYGVRGLIKAPGFTATVVLTLALAIGATTAIFSLLDAVLLKSLPVRDPERLVLVGGSQYPVFQAFQQTGVFVDLLATSGVTSLDSDLGDGQRQRAAVSLVSGSYFSTLGVPAVIGRTLSRDDDRVPGQHPVAVVSHRYWQERLGRDPNVAGRTIRISATPITIVGVAPSGFFGEEVGVAPDLWIPLTMWGSVVPGPEPAAESRDRLAAIDWPGTTRRARLRSSPQAHGDLQAGPDRCFRTCRIRRPAARHRRRHRLASTGGEGTVGGADRVRPPAGAADGRGRSRPADRLRQHRESAARAVGGTAP